jgi:precorrin isomerase
MQLSNAIVRLGANVPALPLHERAKASILLRRHIHDDLKMEYLEVRDPLELWTKLKERFSPQRTTVLPKAQNTWANLRFLDFKSVAAYNTAIHRIVAQLRFCGQIITDIEMIQKTLETFHPTTIWYSSSSIVTTSTRSTVTWLTCCLAQSLIISY